MKWLLAFLLAATASAQLSVRTNIGGSGYTDINGAAWAADSGCDPNSTIFSSGNTISGTSDQTLYRTGRQGQGFACTYTVSFPAFYYVTVKFAETNAAITTSNPRIFNVFVNNALQRTINIVGNGGARNAASDYTFGPIAVTGTSITVLFSSVSNPAEVQAIDIEYAGFNVNGFITVGGISIVSNQFSESPVVFVDSNLVRSFALYTKLATPGIIYFSRYDISNVYVDDIFTVDRTTGDITFPRLSGSGNDYACLDSTGKLFRSNSAC